MINAAANPELVDPYDSQSANEVAPVHSAYPVQHTGQKAGRVGDE